MHTIGRRRGAALAAAVVLLVLATVLANRFLPGWAYPLNGLVATACLLGVARWAGLGLAEVGLDRRFARRAALVGAVGVVVVGAVFGAALLVPAWREVFHDGRVVVDGVGALLWVVLVRIPLGTVLLEEVAFRGVLPALLGAGERWRWGPVLGASALFGLWHILPSLALRENAAVDALLGDAPVLVTVASAVVASAVAGVGLHWCRHVGRGVLAPVLVHLATNCGGVLAAWWVLHA
ncbi:CPBP family intramembrane glutamic endopeptidase [Saccharothrix xinjiangensis]|uniref:CPBP family intramembrane glutamic endopeptidase n=1 Tax=Saccharothrix xinjiangensis TaxID=204798 RepID=A0ABV9Y776_9PSEU